MTTIKIKGEHDWMKEVPESCEYCPFVTCLDDKDEWGEWLGSFTYSCPFLQNVIIEDPETKLDNCPIISVEQEVEG